MEVPAGAGSNATHLNSCPSHRTQSIRHPTSDHHSRHPRESRAVALKITLALRAACWHGFIAGGNLEIGCPNSKNRQLLHGFQWRPKCSELNQPRATRNVVIETVRSQSRHGMECIELALPHRQFHRLYLFTILKCCSSRASLSRRRSRSCEAPEWPRSGKTATAEFWACNPRSAMIAGQSESSDDNA